MDIKYHMPRCFFLAASLVLIVGCDQQAQTKQEVSAASQPVKHYSNEILTAGYPGHWKFRYDDSPVLYADRGIEFDVPEFSRASIYIYNGRPMESADLADHFERELKLTSSEYIKHYQRTAIEAAGFKGLKLSWQDTMLVSIAIEITVVKISNSPNPVLVVFQLLDDDIEKESTQIIPFINSITFKT